MVTFGSQAVLQFTFYMFHETSSFSRHQFMSHNEDKYFTIHTKKNRCTLISEGQTTRATSILGPKTASFYSSARLASVFWSSTRLGILDFSAGLRILGSEYSTFRPAFKYSARNTRLFGRPSNTRLFLPNFRV